MEQQLTITLLWTIYQSDIVNGMHRLFNFYAVTIDFLLCWLFDVEGVHSCSEQNVSYLCLVHMCTEYHFSNVIVILCIFCSEIELIYFSFNLYQKIYYDYILYMLLSTHRCLLNINMLLTAVQGHFKSGCRLDSSLGPKHTRV